ncbi:MAG: apolipoprotein N-acyltransferase, partial [Spirochaetales bacterium]|nr:apolipoprotein N-acyltransferase [Spirochaetales bacterium]
KTFHPLAILIAPVLESVQYIILFPVLKSARKLFKKRYYIAQSIFYSGYLYLTQQGFLAYPYGNLTSAIYGFTAFIQIVAITGIWGLGFLMVLFQTLISEMLSEWRFYKKDIAIISILFIMNECYGLTVLNYYRNKEVDESIRIAAIQHNADTWQGGYDTYEKNFHNLRDLTLEAMKENPDMVVWSETAFVPSVSWHEKYPSSSYTSKLCKEFVDFGLTLDVPLVTGNPEGVIKDESLPPFLKDGSWNWKTYNTVIHFADGSVQGTYRKQHLVPFTEHFPYEKQFPTIYRILLEHDYKWWEEGTEATVFSFRDLKFSTPICFEDTFGVLSANFVRNGADMIINLSNDFWSQSVQAEEQHMQLAIFRAIENRRPMIRSTNSGITCLVLPSGDIVDPLEPFTMTYHIYTVPVDRNQKLTFYTRYPDLFGKIFLIMSPIVFIYGLFCMKENRKKEEFMALVARYEHIFDSVDDRYEC